MSKNPLVPISIALSIVTIASCLEYKGSRNDGSRSIAGASFSFAFATAMTAASMDKPAQMESTIRFNPGHVKGKAQASASEASRKKRQDEAA